LPYPDFQGFLVLLTRNADLGPERAEAFDPARPQSFFPTGEKRHPFQGGQKNAEQAQACPAALLEIRITKASFLFRAFYLIQSFLKRLQGLFQNVNFGSDLGGFLSRSVALKAGRDRIPSPALPSSPESHAPAETSSATPGSSQSAAPSQVGETWRVVTGTKSHASAGQRSVSHRSRSISSRHFSLLSAFRLPGGIDPPEIGFSIDVFCIYKIKPSRFAVKKEISFFQKTKKRAVPLAGWPVRVKKNMGSSGFTGAA
jgi:hypothetical protein